MGARWDVPNVPETPEAAWASPVPTSGLPHDCKHLGRLPWPGLNELPDLMARMQLNCIWMDSILCCLCTASLLNSICDVKPRLIMEKQIRFCKLNSHAFPPSQGVSPWPPLRAAILPSYLPTLLSQTLIITPVFTDDPPGGGSLKTFGTQLGRPREVSCP